MERHFVQQIEQLKSEIIRMGSVAEQMVDGALRAFLDRSPEAAESVFRQEHQVNAYEIGIDNEVADMLALHQPVARDLRFLPRDAEGRPGRVHPRESRGVQGGIAERRLD
ncbi:MAG: phosphate uptake regulator [Bacteroidetes bacterium]|nr:phosphate uptake regulator [Bacteroidota bacterium]